MNRAFKIVLIIVVVLLIVGGGVFLYFTRPAAAPSEDISAAVQNSTSSAQPNADTFNIVPSRSLASFRLTEVLYGKNNTVIGTTTQVGGAFELNMTNPFNSTVGEMKVNARTLTTDNSDRNGVIASAILKSDDPANEFITYTPSALTGMPTSAIQQGVPFSFQLDGDMTIAGVDGDATWTGSATLVSPTELVIDASTTVSRADYKLVIPNIPFVANVSDNVVLSVHAVADEAQ